MCVRRETERGHKHIQHTFATVTFTAETHAHTHVCACHTREPPACPSCSNTLTSDACVSREDLTMIITMVVRGKGAGQPMPILAAIYGQKKKPRSEYCQINLLSSGQREPQEIVKTIGKSGLLAPNVKAFYDTITQIQERRPTVKSMHVSACGCLMDHSTLTQKGGEGGLRNILYLLSRE